MTRKRFNRVSWSICSQCGKAETKIAKSIHGGVLKRCCGDWIYRYNRSIRFMAIATDYQIEYAIAWGVE